MKAKVHWQEGLAFTGVADSGFPIRMDGAKAVGGKGGGVGPMEMIALGLAGCTAMDVISILHKKRQNVTDFEVKIDAPRLADHPQVFTRAILMIVVIGHDVEEAALLRAIELAATKYCPAHAMLEQVFPIEIYYEIYQNEVGGKHLTHQGVWQNLMLE